MPHDASQPPPYFDTLLAGMDVHDPQLHAAFGRHVHWGYWPEPGRATGSGDDYGEAAERLCRLVCDAGEVRPGQRVLDVGCGFGGTVASLNERFDRLDLIGLNIDPRQLEYARRHVTPRSGNQIAWVNADACQMPLESESFDVVLAVECVFHFDRQRFFHEASRLLRPNGRLAISDFCPTPRAVEYFADSRFTSDEAIRRTYGDIDLGWSVNEYHRLAEACHLRPVLERDITAHTLPTYDFLLRNAANSPNREDAEPFIRATQRLAKASRKGLLQYTVLAFEKPAAFTAP